VWYKNYFQKQRLKNQDKNTELSVCTHIKICKQHTYKNMYVYVYVSLVEGIPLCLKYIYKLNYTTTQRDTTI
jgi:hypothetical protein